MGLSRHLNSSGVAHANADSPTHASHVRQRAAQRSLTWIPEAAEENPAQEFRLQADGLNLGKGAYWIGFGDDEAAVSGQVFEGHCNAINWARRWNFAQMTRGSKKSQVRRQRTSPACEEFVVNFSPWQMRFINQELAQWASAGVPPEKRQEMLSALVDELRSDIVGEFQRESSREVVSSYCHFDSNKIHVGVVHSRVNAKHELVGDKRLGTAGPWTVSQNRIAKLGLVDAGDQRLKENLERFHSRYGPDRQPLDIALHDRLDKKFTGLVASMGTGAEKRFEAAKDYYKSWKLRARREAAFRSPSSQAVGLRTLRLVAPLLPPQVRAAISIARTCVQAFRVVSCALDAIAAPAVPLPMKTPQPQLATPR